jgi:hypothetical protein
MSREGKVTMKLVTDQAPHFETEGKERAYWKTTTRQIM